MVGEIGGTPIISYQRLGYMNQLVPRQVQVYISLYDWRIIDQDLSYIHGIIVPDIWRFYVCTDSRFQQFAFSWQSWDTHRSWYLKILCMYKFSFRTICIFIEELRIVHLQNVQSPSRRCSKFLLHRISELKSTYEIVNRHRLKEGKAQMQ